MDQRTWRSVFNNMNEACGELSGYTLELFYDPGIVSVVDEGLQALCLREENDARAVRILLRTLRPSEEAQRAMRGFCERNGLQRILTSEEAQRDAKAVRPYRAQPSSSNREARQPDERSSFAPSYWKAKLFRKAFRSPHLRSTLANAIDNAGKSRAIHENPLTLPAPCLCFGRSKEVDVMSEAFCAATKHTHFAIVGGGGMGKTSLANALVHDDAVAEMFGQRRYWVNLEGSSTQTALIQSIIEVLLISADSGLQGIKSCLASAPALLVLDDLDALAARDHARTRLGSVLDSLASACSLVITLRDAHPLSTNLVWHTKIRLERLDPVSAARTFCAVADSHVDDPDLGALIEQCDGLPLTIRLLSHQAAAGEPLSQLRHRWDVQRHHLLSAQVPGTKLDNLAVSIELTLAHPRIEAVEDAWTLLRLLAPVTEGLSFDRLDKLFEGIGVPSSLGALLDLGLVHCQQHSIPGNLRPHYPVHYSIVTPVRTYIFDTVRCPSSGMMSLALEARPKPFAECGLSLRRMKVFEMMNTPFALQYGGLLCIAVAYNRTNGQSPPTLGFRFELLFDSIVLSPSPPGLVADTDGCRPAFISEHKQLPGLETIAESLCRLRDRLAQTESCTPSFHPSVVRSNTEYAATESQMLGFWDPLYRWRHSGLEESSEYRSLWCPNSGPAVFCFVMPPAPVYVRFYVDEVPSQHLERDTGPEKSPLYSGLWAREEIEHLGFQPHHVSISDYDRAGAYFDSCLRAFKLDGRPDSPTLERLWEYITVRRQRMAAFAIALCIKEDNRPEARRRIYVEAQTRGIHQDMTQMVEYLTMEGHEVAESFPRRYLYDCSDKEAAIEAFRSRFGETFAEEDPDVEDLCAACLQALGDILPSSLRQAQEHQQTESSKLGRRLRLAIERAMRKWRRD